MDDAVDDAWRALAEPWRECLRLAWTAYRARTVPVGAVVLRDADGRVVASGRNHIRSSRPSAASLSLDDPGETIEEALPRLLDCL